MNLLVFMIQLQLYLFLKPPKTWSFLCKHQWKRKHTDKLGLRWDRAYQRRSDDSGGGGRHNLAVFYLEAALFYLEADLFKATAELEFVLWLKGIGCVSGAPGCRIDPQPGTELSLLQLCFRSQLWLRHDPWLGNSVCCRLAKNKIK